MQYCFSEWGTGSFLPATIVVKKPAFDVAISAERFCYRRVCFEYVHLKDITVDFYGSDISVCISTYRIDLILYDIGFLREERGASRPLHIIDHLLYPA